MNYFNKIKEYLKDPKKKSLTLLGIYALFFIFVFAITSGSSEPESISNYVEQKEEVSFLDNYKNMKGYEYKFEFIEDNATKSIQGSYYSNTTLFNYNGLRYFYENDLLYVIDNDFYYLSNIEYNITKLFNNSFYTILEQSKEDLKTTYNDNTSKINYSIDSNIFYNYIFGVESNYNSLTNIEITLKDNYIINISIDLTNLNLNLNQIKIEYSNLNNIKSLEFKKDNYTYKE